MRIGTGIIGWGAIAENLHAPCLSGMEECDLIAVCDTREERLAHAKSEYGCEGYRDIDEFLAHPGLQMAVVALPNYLHGPTGVRVLEAGKNVVIEKPMSFSLSETEYMLQIAQKNGLIVTTHQNRRWDPDYLELKRILNEGHIGKPLMIQSRHLGGPWKKTWAGSKKFTGSAPFMSFGPHLLDQILMLAPSGPIHVSGILKSIVHEHDYFNSYLTFSDGSTALVEMSKGNRLKAFPRFHIACEKGDLMVMIDEKQGHWLHKRIDEKETEIRKIPAPPKFHLQSRPFYRNIFSAIRGEASLIVTPEQGRRYVATADAIVRSAQEHKTILVDI